MAGGPQNFSPSQNWQALGGNGLNGYNNQGGAGTPIARDTMDQLRIGVGQVPSAQFPDGFLGEIKSRRGDRLLNSIKQRTNQPSYSRGVHKGERMNPGAYFWPEKLGPEAGINRQMKSKLTNINGVMTYVSPSWAPQMQLTPAPHLVNDGKSNTIANQPGQIDARRKAAMATLRPAWS